MATENPFAPAAPAATPAAAAPAAPAAPADSGEKKRKRNAKPLTAEQYAEIVQRAKNGETPKQIADAISAERNQCYNHLRKVKTILQAIIDDDAETADRKAKAQAELDTYPVREFGSNAGEKRSSASADSIKDLLAAAGL